MEVNDKMAKLSINEDFIIKGKITVRRYLDEDGNINIVGALATHYYFEEIKNIETYRYEIKGIEVLEEVFGSDDFDIVYNFKAKSLIVKNSFSNLSEEEIKNIEDNIYDEDYYLLNSNLSKEYRGGN